MFLYLIFTEAEFKQTRFVTRAIVTRLSTSGSRHPLTPGDTNIITLYKHISRNLFHLAFNCIVQNCSGYSPRHVYDVGVPVVSRGLALYGAHSLLF